MSKDEGIYILCSHTEGDDMLVYQSTDKAVGFIITSTELDENVAIMTDHSGVRKLRDYLNEILGEDQATQPAADEPVAYCDDFTLQKLKSPHAYSVGVTPAAQRYPDDVHALYLDPPAAAHGDEAVLPERRPSTNGTWGDMGDAYSAGWNDCLDRVAEMRAQAGEGDNHA